MSDHHRSSYYKDTYGSSSSSKRYHSPSETSRMGLSSSVGDYYDSSESRSKRSRTDSYTTHTSSTRYADYSASSSSTSGSRYKTTSSSSYYDLPGYKPSSSATSSASKYLDDYKGSSSSRSAPKSNVRRIPPPLTPPSLSSKSSSSIRLQPLMKVSLSTSTSVGSSSASGKDYYGSRMRQAPPEHHYAYSGSYSSSAYPKSDFKRPGSYGYSKSVSTGGYHSTSRPQSSTTAYRSSVIASRRLVARSRIPPSSTMSSKGRGRSSFVSSTSRREDEIRRRKAIPPKRDFKRSRSGSRSDNRSVKSSTKEKKDTEESEKSIEKKQADLEDVDSTILADGQVVVEEVAGDDDEDCDQDDGHMDGANSSVDKSTSLQKDDDQQKDGQSVKSHADELKCDEKNDEDKERKAADKGSEDRDRHPTARALLKLHCPYCDVRCISFREFTFHLRSSIHTRTMSAAVLDMKRKLTKVRQEMKDDQRKREKAEKGLSDTSSYCRVCELSFRTDPKEHEANEIHNKIKALIYRRCDVCNIDFRIWKVHIYHMAALEHAKRVAMKELQEREAKGNNVKGTNLSPEELGLNLVEIRTVFYCNACMRYIPIKGQQEEAKKNHCMTLNHLKSVEDFNEKERRRALREEARERAKRRKQEENEESKTKVNDETGEENPSANRDQQDGHASSGNSGDTAAAAMINIKQEPFDNCENEIDESAGTGVQDEQAEGKKEGKENVGTGEQVNANRNEAEEDDDDEIELHAGEDDVEDESEDTGNWSRRTRSSQRGDGSSN